MREPSGQSTTTFAERTGAEVGVTRPEQLRAALKSMMEHNGCASMDEIYSAVNVLLRSRGAILSDQGKATLRSYINRDAKVAGYVEKADSRSGWRITEEGRRFLYDGSVVVTETAVDEATGQEQSVPSDVVLSSAFERYILDLMKRAYPDHSWQHRGLSKRYERGLDLVGSPFGSQSDSSGIVGVQVKYHQATLQPSEEEWHKFLGGCFVQRVSTAIFITTGRLSGKQQLDAVNARIMVIAGKSEIDRFATKYRLPSFEDYLAAADAE